MDDKIAETRRALQRFDYLFRAAWHAIAVEHKWRHDTWLGTSSHSTLALRARFSATGV